MMNLTVAEIQHLLRRAQRSLIRGYQIARGGEYATALGGTDGSPGGLVDLCKAALGATAEPVAAPDVVDAPATEGEDGPPTWAPPPPAQSPAVEAAEPVEPVESVPETVAAEPAASAEPEVEDDTSAEALEDDAGATEGESAAEEEQPAQGESPEGTKVSGKKKKRGRR